MEQESFKQTVFEQTLWWKLILLEGRVDFEVSPLFKEQFGLEITEYHEFVALVTKQEQSFFTKTLDRLIKGDEESSEFVLDLILQGNSISLQNKVLVKQEADKLIVWSLCADITGRVSLEKKLVDSQSRSAFKEIRYRAERAESEQDLIRQKYQQQTQFLAMLSHELRSPMAGMASLIKNAKQKLSEDSELSQLFSVLGATTEQLMFLVNDILTFSQTQNKSLKLSKSYFNLEEMLDYVQHLTKSLAAEKQTMVSFAMSCEKKDLVGDVVRISQLLINLIVNGIKYTQFGGVFVEIELSQNQQLILKVTDSGEGISQDDIEKIFAPFAQLESGVSQQYLGTGLGLSVVHSLVNLMDGQIKVSSTKGVGTSLEVILPVEFYEAEMPSVMDASAAEVSHDFAEKLDYKVLVADDSLINRMVLKQFVKELGCEVVAVEDGLQACQQFESHPFDFVFLDMQMPNMSGMEAAAQILKTVQEQGENSSLKGVFALTAAHTESELNLMGVEIDKSLFDAWLLKPISQDELLALLLQGHREKRTPKQDQKGGLKMPPLTDNDASSAPSQQASIPAELLPMLPKLITSAEEEMALLNEWVEAENFDEIKKVAHRLKGSFMVFQLTQAVTYLKAIEEEAQEKVSENMLKNLYNVRMVLSEIKLGKSNKQNQ